MSHSNGCVSKKIPAYITDDPKLYRIYANKMKEHKYSRISIANLIYTYISKRGILGDTSWSYFNDFCKMAVSKIPKEVSSKIDYLVCIASGGAFAGVAIAKHLGIPTNKTFIVHISKWSSAKTLLERARLYTSSENEIELTVKQGLTEKQAKALAGKNVLIVDDQACSGSTVRKCRKLVNACGAKMVHTMVLASTCKQIEGVDTIAFHGFQFLWPWGVDS